MENYYFWLSAQQRRNILLRTFVKSWKWTAAALALACSLYALLHNILHDFAFFYLTSLLTSFSLFFVILYKDKFKKQLLFRLSYTAATGIILFWILLALEPAKFFLFLFGAVILFVISALFNLLPWKLSQFKIQLMVIPVIALAVILGFVLLLFNINGFYIFSGVFCLLFMLFNAEELSKMDKMLQNGLTSADIKKMTDDWCFDMFGNFIGMFFYPEAVRILSKVKSLSTSSQAVPLNSSQKVVS